MKELMIQQTGQSHPESDSPINVADAGNKELVIKTPEEKAAKIGKSFFAQHSEFSKTQMKEFREAFCLIDKNGNGSVTKEDLRSVMVFLGQYIRAEELEQIINEVSDNGKISFEEFVDITWSTASDREEELMDAFRVFDKRNRGYITVWDLRAVLQRLGENLPDDEIEDMMKEVDVDGDGRIDFYEFVNALVKPDAEDSCDEDEEIMGC